MSSAFSHGQSRRPPARPALKADAVSKLPRPLLLLLCLAYILPGFVGRDPWRSDGLGFVVMWQMAQGATNWLHPQLYGHAIRDGWLTHWLGAWSIQAFGDWVGPVLASRLPFMFALALSMGLTWYAAYHFARDDAAQPVPPAFGAPIAPRDYARAIADGVLLTLLATLGLLGRGHEASTQVLQLAAVSAVLLGVAMLPRKPATASGVIGSALLALALTSAGWFALALTLTLALLLWRDLNRQRWPLWLALLVGLAAGVWAEAQLGWTLRGRWPSLDAVGNFFRIGVWFTWPAWPLALWALWRWRESLHARHLRPAWVLALLALLGALALGNNDKVFLLSLPPMAILAGFALPVMRRAGLAAIDWFAVLFYSLLALLVWVMWLAMLTGWPPKPAANVARLAPGFRLELDPLSLAVALAATVAWAAIVLWRTGRHRHPLWKGMVLSAGGVTLAWVLVGSLWMPVLNYASTYRAVGAAVAQAVLTNNALAMRVGTPCLQPEGIDLTAQALIGYWSGLGFAQSGCPYALGSGVPAPAAHWRLIWRGGRPGERSERIQLYQRLTRTTP
jgi:4-amino-4-deoxy-L-arabinose transferase-like glycosyltransferase